jgi:hypothetical protein
MTKTSKAGTTRDEVERELLRRDKQSLISYCLKMLDKIEVLDKDRAILADKLKLQNRLIDQQAEEIRNLRKASIFGMIRKKILRTF